MIVRADQCIFRFLAAPKALIIVRPKGDNRIRWRCTHEELKSSGARAGGAGRESFVKAIGLDYKLYDTTCAYVGTLMRFSLDQVNTGAIYQVVTSKRTLKCTVTHVELDGETLYPEHQRGLVLPEGANLQSVGGSMTGWGDPGVVKGTRIR